MSFCPDHLRTYLASKGYPEDRIGVVKLGINTTRFSDPGAEERIRIRSEVLGVSDDTLVVVMNSALDHHNKAHLVPDIMNSLFDQFESDDPNLRPTKALMLMLGSGELHRVVSERIVFHGLEDSVKILGPVGRRDLILRAADIFIHPGRLEGISLPLAEAMSSGEAATNLFRKTCLQY